MVNRVYNFSAGPAMLPEEVLKEAASEMMDYRGCGMSVMEMSHRSQVFDDIIHEAEQDYTGPASDSGQLQGIISSGRSITAVCHDPHEPDEAWSGRLYRDRPVGKEGISGSTEIRKGQQDRLFRG